MHKAQLQGMQSIRERDAKERVVRIYGGAMSTEVGKVDRGYLRAVEKKAGKELFERDEENEITLYVKKNTATSTHGSAKMEYYVGIVEAEILKEIEDRRWRRRLVFLQHYLQSARGRGPGKCTQ